MITRVLLRNWRGYEKLSLDLGPGLTFVVADNGVGKTSLVHGASWALFGDASGVDADAAIRAGTDETTTEVDLVVGDVKLVVSRSLRRLGRRRERLEVKVEHADPGLDLGTAATSAELVRALASAVQVPQDILPQLMFVPEMRLTHEGELFADVQDHLAALLGIDSLRRAARTAQDVAAATARQVRTAREVARVDQRALATARAEVERLRTELGELDTAIEDDLSARDELDRLRRRLDSWARYDEQLAQHQQRLDTLTQQARDVGLDADPDAIADAARDLTERSNELRDTLAQARAEGELVEGLVDQLGSAEAVCPVCLRPVDDETAHQAAASHQARLAEIAEREAEAARRQAEVEAAARKVIVIAGALARQRPPEPPAVARPELTEAELLSRMTELDTRLAERQNRKGAVEERLRQAEATLAEADQRQAAAAKLARLHAVGAAAASLAELARAEADARTERSLDPLSRALADRWSEFFGVRSSRPRLAGGGTIELSHGGRWATNAAPVHPEPGSPHQAGSPGVGAGSPGVGDGLGEAGEPGVGGGAAGGGEGAGDADVASGPTAATIPYSSFSGGEKTLASLLTRLLFVTSATRLRTMWLDEPLEHLDPANRSRLARLVAQATRPGSHMHQVVVTTYEEGLARVMADRHDATLLYVSTDDLL